MFRKVSDVKILIRQIHKEKLNPLFDTLTASIKDVSPEASESGLKLIKEISHRANVMIVEQGQSDIAVQAVIDSMLQNASPDALAIYKNYRVIGDWILDTVNESIGRYNALIKDGIISAAPLSTVPRRPGWVPFIYKGDYVVKVYNVEGRQISTDFVDDAEGLVKSLKRTLGAEGNTEVQGRVVVEPKFLTEASDMEVMGPFMKDLKSIFGRDADEIRKLIGAGRLTKDTVNDVFLNNLLPRTLNLEERTIDVIPALFMNASSALRFANYASLVKRGQNLSRLFIDTNRPRLGKYISTYMNDLLGRSRGFEKDLDEILKKGVAFLHKVPGFSPLLDSFGITENGRVLRSVVSGLTFLGRASVLGLNVGSAIINTMIFGTNVAPKIGFGNAAFALRNAYRMLGKNSPYKRMLKYAGIEYMPTAFGMREIMTTPDMFIGRGSRYVQKLDSLFMWLFNTSENMTRALTVIGADRQAKQISRRLIKGKVPKTRDERMLSDIAKEKGLAIDHETVRMEFSKRQMLGTNFNFDATDLPELMRNPTLKPFLQFKTFFTKELEFLFAGDLTKAELAKALGMLGALGGAVAMPGINEIDWLSRATLGYSPKLFIEDNLPEIPAIGFASMFGLNLSNRVAFGDLFFAADPQNLFGIAPARIFQGLKAVSQGRPERAAAFITPVAFRNFFDAIDLLSGGEIRSPFTGQAVLTKEEITNPIQLLGRAVGFRTTVEEKQRLRVRAAQAFKNKNIRDRRAGMTAYINAVRRGDFKEASKIQREHGFNKAQINAAVRRLSRSRQQIIKDIIGRDTSDQLSDALRGF